jgi:hypothetical protein
MPAEGAPPHLHTQQGDWVDPTASLDVMEERYIEMYFLTLLGFELCYHPVHSPIHYTDCAVLAQFYWCKHFYTIM